MAAPVSPDEARAEVAQEAVIAELRTTLRHVSGQLRKEKNRTDALVEVCHRAAYEAVLIAGGVPAVDKPGRDGRRRGEEVALWHMTDWQYAKKTPTYDSATARERVLRFARKAIAITDIQRADHPVKLCVIMFGGDMGEGLFQFATQPYEIDATIFDQYVGVGMLLVEVVRIALSAYEAVVVVSEWGNHGRIGSKRDAVPRSDNLDRMAYELARRLLAGEPRLTWQECPEDIQRVEVGNYRALLMHGDEVGRAGFASPTQWIAHGNRWGNGAYKVDSVPWPFQDIYLGHYHRHAQEPLADGLGAIYWTGSTESDNRYARDSMAASGVPSQRLHFINPDAGRITAQYQVWVDG